MARRRRTRAARAADRGRAPQVAGHEIIGPVGFGAGGTVWSARDRAGRDVVVSVLPLPGGDAGTAQLRRLAALRHGSHPHLATIRQVVALDAGRCAVVSDRVPGSALATVVAARGRLAAPELAGLLAGVGSALGHLHERGVVHGDVSPANVVVTEDGVPVLVDLAGLVTHELGTPGFVPPERRRGGAAGAPGDVWALARLLEWAAGTPPSPRLLRLLGPALDVDATRRPGARDLASRAPEIGQSYPIAVPSAAALAQARLRDDAAPTRRRPATRREYAATARPSATPRPVAARAVAGDRRAHAAPAGRRDRRVARHARRRAVRAAWLGAVLSLGTAAVLGGLIARSAPEEQAARHAHPPAPAVRETQQPDGDVVAELPDGDVVAELLARRDRALETGDLPALAATSVPGGQAAREGAELLELLEATGTTLEQLRTEVAVVEAVTEVADGTAVDVVLVQQPHDRVVADRRVTVPAQPPRCARLVLAAGEDDAWRLLRSEPCP